MISQPLPPFPPFFPSKETTNPSSKIYRVHMMNGRDADETQTPLSLACNLGAKLRLAAEATASDLGTGSRKFYFWDQIQAKDAGLSSDHPSKILGRWLLEFGRISCLFVYHHFISSLLFIFEFSKKKQKFAPHLLYRRHLFSQ